MILILSRKNDTAAGLVIAELKKREKDYIHLNLEDANQMEFAFNIIDGEWKIKVEDIEIDLINLKSVLYRKPLYPLLNDEKFPAGIRNFIQSQWHSLIRGLIQIPNVFWINNFELMQIAELKLLQLSKAKEIGFEIPETLITNSITCAREFSVKNNLEIITKALFSRTIKNDGDIYMSYTNEIGEITDDLKNELALLPIIFQKKIYPKDDLRIVVLGEKVFCGKIGTVKLDWRKSIDDVTLESYRLPDDIADKCIRIVKEFGLYYGAIDLVKKDEHYYFLELNSCGEWDFLQTLYPIAEVIADML